MNPGVKRSSSHDGWAGLGGPLQMAVNDDASTGGCL